MAGNDCPTNCACDFFTNCPRHCFQLLTGQLLLTRPVMSCFPSDHSRFPCTHTFVFSLCFTTLKRDENLGRVAQDHSL